MLSSIGVKTLRDLAPMAGIVVGANACDAACIGDGGLTDMDGCVDIGAEIPLDGVIDGF